MTDFRGDSAKLETGNLNWNVLACSHPASGTHVLSGTCCFIRRSRLVPKTKASRSERYRRRLAWPLCMQDVSPRCMNFCMEEKRSDKSKGKGKKGKSKSKSKWDHHHLNAVSQSLIHSATCQLHLHPFFSCERFSQSQNGGEETSIAMLEVFWDSWASAVWIWNWLCGKIVSLLKIWTYKIGPPDPVINRILTIHICGLMGFTGVK